MFSPIIDGSEVLLKALNQSSPNEKPDGDQSITIATTCNTPQTIKKTNTQIIASKAHVPQYILATPLKMDTSIKQPKIFQLTTLA